MIDFSNPGRMLSGSKSGYMSKYPNNTVVFNANLCLKSKGKMWYGDVDIHRDIDQLKQFAKEQGETLYILREYDARFDNELKPLYEKAVVSIEPNGTVDWKAPR